MIYETQWPEPCSSLLTWTVTVNMAYIYIYIYISASFNILLQACFVFSSKHVTGAVTQPEVQNFCQYLMFLLLQIYYMTSSII